MIALLRVLIVLGGVASGLLYFVRKLMVQAQWRKGINQADYDLLHRHLLNSPVELVALSKEELQLLSLNVEKKKIRFKSGYFDYGMFKSIYEENHVEFCVLNYDKFQQLILARTAQYDFAYKVGARITDIYVNGNLIGRLDHRGALKNPENQKQIAKIDASRQAKFQQIQRDGKELAMVFNPMFEHGYNERAIQNVQYADDQEKLILLSLVFLNAIQRS